MGLPGKRIYYLIAFIPFLYIILLPLINRVNPKILGIPLLWFITFIWVVFVSICILVLWFLEEKMRYGQ